MQEQTPTYLEMQTVNPTLASGRDTDLTLTRDGSSPADSLLDAYRKARLSFGGPFGKRQAKAQTK